MSNGGLTVKLHHLKMSNGGLTLRPSQTVENGFQITK